MELLHPTNYFEANFDDSACKTMPDPAGVDVISRFYPRVLQAYAKPDAPENTRWEHLLAIAQQTNDPRPVLTSKYAHAMGNAIGNLQEYWDEIYSSPRMLGGFIWEWCDQGLRRTLPDGRRLIAYGGDFGDQPNLGHLQYQRHGYFQPRIQVAAGLAAGKSKGKRA
jgi:beta-galactosidase/beta-glucuronidase